MTDVSIAKIVCKTNQLKTTLILDDKYILTPTSFKLYMTALLSRIDFTSAIVPTENDRSATDDEGFCKVKNKCYCIIPWLHNESIHSRRMIKIKAKVTEIIF